MQIVKQKQTHRVDTSPTTSIEEYRMRDSSISGATVILSGRYPEEGFAVNKISHELVLVLSGSGIIGINGKEIEIELGNCILIRPNEKFYWRGHMALFMACAPSWKTRQHHIVKTEGF